MGNGFCALPQTKKDVYTCMIDSENSQGISSELAKIGTKTAHSMSYAHAINTHFEKDQHKGETSQ